MSFFYPPLDPATIQALDVIRSLIAESPDYFDESPYSSETDTLLAKWFRPLPKLPQAQPVVVAAVPEVDDQGHPVETMIFEGLREEIKQAYLHLKSAKNDKNQDKVAWAKNAVNLLEKLVKLDGQATNIEMVGNFQREIIAILEEICTPEQREKIAGRVEQMISPNINNISEILRDDEISEPESEA